MNSKWPRSWGEDSGRGDGKTTGAPVPGDRGISAGAEVGVGITGNGNQLTVDGDVVSGDKHEISTTTEYHYHASVTAAAGTSSTVLPSRVDRQEQAELILVGPLNTHVLAPLLRRADTVLSTDPEQAARLYGEIASSLHATGFHGHAAVMQRKQMAALQAAGHIVAAVEMAGSLAVASLRAGDHDQAWSLARDIPRLAFKSTEAGEPRADRAERIAKLLQAAAESLLHPLGDLESLREVLSGTSAEQDPEYRPVLILLLAEQALAFNPASVHELDALVSEAINTLDNGGDDADHILLRLRLIRAHYDPSARRALHQQARRHHMTGRPAAMVFAREGRRLAEEGEADAAVEAYRDAVDAGIRADLTQDAADWLYSIRSINVSYGPLAGDIDDEHRLAQALRATGTGRLLVRARQPREQALSALVREKPREAITAAQRWLVDTVVTGDWTGELEALRFLADLYQDNTETGLAADYYQRAGEAERAKKLAAASGDTLLPLGPLQGVPWRVSRARAAQLEAQADLLDDDAATALLGELIDMAQQLLSGDLADSPLRHLLHQVLRSACTLAPRGTAEQAGQVLTDLVDSKRTHRGATWFAIADRHPSLALQAVTKLLDEAEQGSYDAWESLGERRWIQILISPSSPLTAAEQAACQTRLAALANLADDNKYPAALALSQAVPDHPTVRTAALEALNRILSRPAPDPHNTTIGDQLANDALLVCQLDEPSRRRCAARLMEIASDRREIADARRSALTGLCNLITDLPPVEKSAIYRQAQPFVLGEQDGSHLDSEMTGTPHPLSAARISFGTASLRGPALELAHRAAELDEEHHWVRENAVALLRTDVPSDVGDAARVLAYLPPQIALSVDPALLVTHHNRTVRQAGAFLAVSHASQHPRTIRRLAEDNDHTVRRTLAEVAELRKKEGPVDPVVPEVLERLADDVRASVRHAALAAARAS
ncbi:hypothetical protein OHA84_36755 [Streptomyces sp. NBC_00513]|uniref:hypothetical protein n=1 Tax=unclassified Streptomyces TaxID=2593676 RepID=UPI00225A7BB5|nr:hypothetical protein [Streptomyces sp. NBC_00424]MCX5078673.1 hypothetical protein [Streptomyces sp. NBC_00424]WUD39116.1 hypothetical protein OHA84_00545 [Streptomyces sp. NBC_00513]WUD45613.1 hypothetical protein OHA84_36755 [Streptomyces sp. NBC_00513]